jgi:hypothetical protein
MAERGGVRPLGANAQVGTHGGDPVVIAQGRAGLPAVANLHVLVAQRGVFALVGLRLVETQRAQRPATAGGRSNPWILGAQPRRGTPIASAQAHVAYRAIVGGFASIAG